MYRNDKLHLLVTSMSQLTASGEGVILGKCAL